MRLDGVSRKGYARREELGMAKRETRRLPARKANRSNDDSLLLRSAESLGRVIGSLQRQVQVGSKRVASAANDVMDSIPEIPSMNDLVGARRKPRRKTTRARKTAGARKKSAARKTGRTRARTASKKSAALKR
jgi:hypothetical protein